MKKIVNPYIGDEGYNCIGCCPDNPFGLHLEFYEDGDEVCASWHPSANYQGWVETLHGGIVSMLLDEVAGWVVFHKLQSPGYTVRLNVKFLKPVKTTEEVVHVRCRLVEQHRRFATIHCELRNAAGELCDEAEAVYCVMSADHAEAMHYKPSHTEEVTE